jgi:hypothetical protein
VQPVGLVALGKTGPEPPVLSLALMITAHTARMTEYDPAGYDIQCPLLARLKKILQTLTPQRLTTMNSLTKRHKITLKLNQIKSQHTEALRPELV